MFNSTIISTKRQPDKAKNPVNSHCRQAKLSNEKNLKEKLYRPLTIMDTLDRVRLFKFETENHTRQNFFFLFLVFFLRWHECDLLQKKKHFAIIIIIIIVIAGFIRSKKNQRTNFGHFVLSSAMRNDVHILFSFFLRHVQFFFDEIFLFFEFKIQNIQSVLNSKS